jgi:endonuclease YncB( thermonuclease family)
MQRVGWKFCLFLMAGMQGAQAGVPCIVPTKTVRATVVRVEDSGMLVLAGGRIARLEGIRFPQGAVDRAPPNYAEKALDSLRAMTRGQDATLAIRWPEEDRYGRLRAQGFVAGRGDLWLQTALLKQGLARVSPMPARTECMRELYAAENQARDAQLGIWSDAAYAVRTPDDVEAVIGTFQIVEGKVLNANVKGGRTYLNFGTDWKTDFTVTIDPEDKKAFRDAGVDPTGYAGHIVRVRGLVQRLNGPEIEIASPAQIETLPQK